MTTRKRPSLRDNMTDGGDDTARQLEQAAEIEQMRRGEAAPDAPAAKSAFEDSPSPVAALAHAYMHGPSDAPPAASSGRGLNAVAAALGVTALGLAAAAGVLSVKEHRAGTAVASAPAAAAPSATTPSAPTSAPAVAPPVSGTTKAAAAPAAAPAAPAQPAELQTRIGALENTLGSVFTGGLTDRVTALENRVAQISGSSQVVGILAARQLRGALAESAPFHSELALARLSGVADGELAKALDRVAPRAAEGIPTRGDLAARFAVLVPAALNAELGASGVGGIGQTMWGWVTGVATVLRLPASGTVEESKSAELLTRAGIMLEAGDLTGAAERVSLLDGPAAQAAGPWVADARARAAADQAATLLANRISDLLAAGRR